MQLPILDPLYARRLRNPGGPETASLNISDEFLKPAADSQGFNLLAQPRMIGRDPSAPMTGGVGYTPPPRYDMATISAPATGGIRGRNTAAAPVDVSNPAAVAYLAQQAQADAVNTQTFNRQIAPNLPDAGQTPEINASRFAYLNQLAAQASGAPSIRTNDMLAPAPVINTAANGRRILSQNPASLQAAANGLTPQAWNQQRAMQLANSFAESQTPQPRASTLSFEGGTKINILTDANGNTRVIEPPKENAPDTSALAKYIAERDAAIAADRPDLAQLYDTMINNYVAKGGKEAPMDAAAFATALGGMMGVKPATAPAATPTPAAPALAAAPIPTYSMPAPSPVTRRAPAASSKDYAGAAKWLSENPNDPRAPMIRAKLQAANAQ